MGSGLPLGGVGVGRGHRSDTKAPCPRPLTLSPSPLLSITISLSPPFACHLSATWRVIWKFPLLWLLLSESRLRSTVGSTIFANFYECLDHSQTHFFNGKGSLPNPFPLNPTSSGKLQWNKQGEIWRYVQFVLILLRSIPASLLDWKNRCNLSEVVLNKRPTSFNIWRGVCNSIFRNTNIYIFNCLKCWECFIT